MSRFILAYPALANKFWLNHKTCGMNNPYT